MNYIEFRDEIWNTVSGSHKKSNESIHKVRKYGFRAVTLTLNHLSQTSELTLITIFLVKYFELR